MARNRKRFIVIAPRYTFKEAKPCICIEDEALMILQREKIEYNSIINGPDCKEREDAKYYSLRGIALIKIRQSDGRYLTKDIISNEEYMNDRLPDIDFKPVYLIGHKADFYIRKEDRVPGLTEVIEKMKRMNEIKSDEELFTVVQFIKMTSWWAGDFDTKKLLKRILWNFKEVASSHQIVLINMASKLLTRNTYRQTWVTK